MRKSRRATKVWLILLGLMLAPIFASGILPSQVLVIGLALYLIMALIGLGLFDLDELRRRLPQAGADVRITMPRRRSRVRASSAAQRAQERASSLAGYEGQFTLADIGLIVSEMRPDGLHLRRDDLTLDDEGIQPYVVIDADSSWANETVTAQFEILDQSGQLLFRHVEDVYLREGQNNILSSNRLPLGTKAPAGVGPGLWELRVTLAGSVIGLHTFPVGPSLTSRQRMIGDLERRRGRLTDQAAAPVDDSPVSLEELLRGQQ
ncbi:MAG: hypothetical protein HPY64_16810 [Anaerolineae bacterium]|nr:hypothetical protein [Anaerolineae bacterium]